VRKQRGRTKVESDKLKVRALLLAVSDWLLVKRFDAKALRSQDATLFAAVHEGVAAADARETAAATATVMSYE
jgi:hypothetical protein